MCNAAVQYCNAQWLNVVGTPCNNYFRKSPQKLTYSTFFLRFKLNFLHCRNLRAFRALVLRAQKTSILAHFCQFEKSQPANNSKNFE